MTEIDGAKWIDIGNGGIQFFAPHEMLVVVEEIISSFSP